MVQIRTGAGVTQISGSSSGNTFSHNRSGMYMRSRTTPVNTHSDGHAQSRSIFTKITKLWSSDLTDSQRDGWSTYAAAISVKNKLGESVHLTGQLMFVRSNQARLTAGLSPMLIPPTSLYLPEPDINISFIAMYPLQALWVYFNPASRWATTTGAYLMIHLGRTKKLTTNFYNGPWHYADKIAGSSESPPTSPMALQLPEQKAVGQKIFAKFLCAYPDGRVTNPFYSNTIVVE